MTEEPQIRSRRPSTHRPRPRSPHPPSLATASRPGPGVRRPPKIVIRDLSVYYGAFRAVTRVTLDVAANRVTAIIGPSGCGKSTLLRTLNRMTDLVPDARATGEVALDGENILDPRHRRGRRAAAGGHGVPASEPVPQVDLRQRGLRPAPVRRARSPIGRDRRADAAHAAALWDEVKDKLRQSALALSGGQQQRAVHRSGDGRRAGGDPDGRAMLRTRPDRDAPDRGADRRAAARRTPSSSSPTTCSKPRG